MIRFTSFIQVVTFDLFVSTLLQVITSQKAGFNSHLTSSYAFTLPFFHNFVENSQTAKMNTVTLFGHLVEDSRPFAICISRDESVAYLRQLIFEDQRSGLSSNVKANNLDVFRLEGVATSDIKVYVSSTLAVI